VSVGAGHAWFFCVFLNDDDRGTFFFFLELVYLLLPTHIGFKKKEKIVFLFFSHFLTLSTKC
jgi:hypothetical protein